MINVTDGTKCSFELTGNRFNIQLRFGIFYYGYKGIDVFYFITINGVYIDVDDNRIIKQRYES
jgi:hypothetical protein